MSYDYETIFSSLDRSQSIRREEVEMLFFYQTKQSYRDHLFDLYITQKLTQQSISDLLNLPFHAISNHLQHYNISKGKIKRVDGIYSKVPEDIEKETGRKFLDIIHELIDKGYSPTEITIQLKLKSGSYVSTYLKREREQQELSELNEDDYILPGLSGMPDKDIEQRFKDELNINLRDWLYDKFMNDGLSTFDIRKLTGMNEKKIQRLLRSYGIHKSKSKIRQDLMDRGIINYTEINNKSRKTRNKTISRSNKQDIFRELIKHYLQFELNNNTYTDTEVIIGANEWGILHTKEVDIAIIVIHNDKFYKFSVEYNNEVWHDDKKDHIKETELISKGWIHYTFDEARAVTASMVPMEQRAKEIANSIINHVINHN